MQHGLLGHSITRLSLVRALVTDAADIIGEQQEAALSKRLAAFEQATGHQMVSSPLNPWQDVAGFTRELVNDWGIGRRDHNDGVVALIASNERRVRTAVGHGLEAALPLSLCQTIIDLQMLPRFPRRQVRGRKRSGRACSDR